MRLPRRPAKAGLLAMTRTFRYFEFLSKFGFRASDLTIGGMND
jgi:hypothetical protein